MRIHFFTAPFGLLWASMGFYFTISKNSFLSALSV